MARAADTYCSRKDGETFRKFATLSKPLAWSSFGRSAAASMRSPSRSSIALAYSARLSRCSATRPGFGFAAAAASSAFRLPRSGRRHHTAAKFANGLFPDVGVLRNIGNVHRVEHHSGRFRPLVVTRHAVLV